MTLHSLLRIGTRGSKLALAQAHEVRDRLLRAHPAMQESDIEIVPIKTTGDSILSQNLADIGGKGLFTKEIEEALLAKEVDIAVHSMKDMPAAYPAGLVVDCILPREDPRDVLISHKYRSITEIAQGATIGTSSTRRAAQLLHLRPDLKIVPFRGNVITRLEKLDKGIVDATILALAGLKRLHMENHIASIIPVETMLPAVAQGAIGIERREDDVRIQALLAPLNHRESQICVTAERAFLSQLDGSCKTPLAGLATLQGDMLSLKAMFATPDGKECRYTVESGSIEDAEKIGIRAAAAVKVKS